MDEETIEYFCVEHWWGGRKNGVAFNNRPSAEAYASKHHAIVQCLYKGDSHFQPVEEINESSESSSSVAVSNGESTTRIIILKDPGE